MNKWRLALIIGIPTACCAAFSIGYVLKLPDDLIGAIEALPAKILLTALCILFSSWLGLLLFCIFYVPGSRKYCTRLGSAVVWSALGCATLPYGCMAIESASLRYFSSDQKQEAVARLRISPSSAVATSCVTILIAALAGLGFATLNFKIAVHEQSHGPLP